MAKVIVKFAAYSKKQGMTFKTFTEKDNITFEEAQKFIKEKYDIEVEKSGEYLNTKNGLLAKTQVKIIGK